MSEEEESKVYFQPAFSGKRPPAFIEISPPSKFWICLIYCSHPWTDPSIIHSFIHRLIIHSQSQRLETHSDLYWLYIGIDGVGDWTLGS